jgi:hypothetical protein
MEENSELFWSSNIIRIVRASIFAVHKLHPSLSNASDKVSEAHLKAPLKALVKASEKTS